MGFPIHTVRVMRKQFFKLKTWPIAPDNVCHFEVGHLIDKNNSSEKVASHSGKCQNVCAFQRPQLFLLASAWLQLDQIQIEMVLEGKKQ